MVGFKGDTPGEGFMIVEVLLDPSDENRLEFYRTSALQTRLGHPGMPPVQEIGCKDGQHYRVREWVEGRNIVFVGAIGADSPGKHELDAGLMAAATTTVVGDIKSQIARVSG